MGFVGAEEVMRVVEGVVKKVWNEVVPGSVGGAVPRMRYREAMSKV
jgi:aspartyl-tRNA synthetase